MHELTWEVGERAERDLSETRANAVSRLDEREITASWTGFD